MLVNRRKKAEIDYDYDFSFFLIKRLRLKIDYQPIISRFQNRLQKSIKFQI